MDFPKRTVCVSFHINNSSFKESSSSLIQVLLEIISSDTVTKNMVHQESN